MLARGVLAGVFTLALLAGAGSAAAEFPAGPYQWNLPADAIASDDTESFDLAGYLTPPKGRVNRKRIMDPSLPSSRQRSFGKLAFKWFWNEVSPSNAAASARRWHDVIGIIEKARGSGKPVFGSRSVAARIVQAYGPHLEREAKKRNLSVALLVAVISVESNGNPGAISPKGAGGLMQLMPATARRFGVSNSLAPAQNIRGGAHYLDWLLRRYRNDAVLALAGYNAGEGAVDKYSGVPPYAETRDYVAKVAGAFSAARGLCSNAPKGARETCNLK